jgi:phosphoglycolate phosphatase
MTPAAVVFDLDGTLVDSRPDLALAVNRMRSELALSALPEATIGAMIGEGARVLVDRALADAPLAVHRPQALASFLAHYATVCTVSTRPYDGIEELLAACHRRWPLALLTNKPIAMTVEIVEHLDWTRYFRFLVGGDSLAFRKPDGRGLEHLAQALEVAVDRVVLVGDSRIDAETARAAGAAFVWVEWGYAAAEDRCGLAGGLSARTPAALANWLDALPQ